MENLVIVWYLMFTGSSTPGYWTVPSPYPTKEVCMEVGEDVSYNGIRPFCVPAPVFDPRAYPDNMFTKKGK